ncbi:MAG: hypothetical protein AAGD13_01035 [Pseudomonadota bacterium]
MSNLSSRIDKLERKNGGGLPPVTSVSVSFFRPGLEGPVDGGPGLITVVGGDQFCRSNFENADDFYAAVNECHLRVHGSPFEPEDEQ